MSDQQRRSGWYSLASRRRFAEQHGSNSSAETGRCAAQEPTTGLLAAIGRALSVPPEQTPELLAGLIEKNKSLEKTGQRLATELARREGKELFLAAEPGPDGIRRIIQRGPIDDAMRARAQAFVAGEKAVFLAVCDQPPSLLLAASADSGIHAGDRIKAAVAAAHGRGGGNQQLGQGSVPDAAALASAEALLR